MIDIEESFNGKYKQFEAGRWQDVMPAGIPFKCGADPNWTADQAWKYQMLAEVLKSEQVIHYSKDQLSSLDVFTTTVSFIKFLELSHNDTAILNRIISYVLMYRVNRILTTIS